MWQALADSHIFSIPIVKIFDFVVSTFCDIVFGHLILFQCHKVFTRFEFILPVSSSAVLSLSSAHPTPLVLSLSLSPTHRLSLSFFLHSPQFVSVRLPSCLTECLPNANHTNESYLRFVIVWGAVSLYI